MLSVVKWAVVKFILQKEKVKPGMNRNWFLFPEIALQSSPKFIRGWTNLYFVSDMPGGQGGKDIWMTVYDKKKKEWGEPSNLRK